MPKYHITLEFDAENIKYNGSFKKFKQYLLTMFTYFGNFELTNMKVNGYKYCSCTEEFCTCNTDEEEKKLEEEEKNV